MILHKLGPALSIALLVVAGCRDEAPSCYAGEFQACSCDGESRGYQRCEGEAYGGCVCDGTTPGLVGAGGGGGNGGAEPIGGSGGQPLLPFMSPCDADEQCETGMCFLFNAKGPRCSKPCTGDEDCPPPSPGCNNKGVCKAP